jgi:putative oxidoreductase
MFVKKWLPILIRYALAAVFAYSGVKKLPDPLAFADSIDSFRLLPPHLVSLAALTLPCFELLSAIMLVLHKTQRAGALAIAIMGAAFSTALASALIRGLEIDCGCFGSQPGPSSNPWLPLMRAVLLFFTATTLYVWDFGSKADGRLHASDNGC